MGRHRGNKDRRYISLYRSLEFNLYGGAWGIYYGLLMANTVSAWPKIYKNSISSNDLLIFCFTF